MQINTVSEQDAYDKGFADAKDYWVAVEQARIVKMLQIEVLRHEQMLMTASADYLTGLINAIEKEEK